MEQYIYDEYRELAVRSLKYDGLPITEESIRDLMHQMMEEDQMVDRMDNI